MATIDILSDEADVALVGGGEPAPITIGQTAFGSVFVENEGVTLPRNGVIRLEADPGLMILAVYSEFGFPCAEDGSVWTCSLTFLPPGSSATINYIVLGTDVGTGLTVHHTATADNDPDLTDNEWSIGIDVYPAGASNLGVQMLTNRVDELGTTNVSIDVFPGGPAQTAQDVTLHVATPGLAAGPITVADGFGNPVGACVTGTEEITCSFDTIDNFDIRSLSFRAIPVSLRHGARIVATVSSPSFDPEPNANIVTSEPYDIVVEPGAPSTPVGTPRDGAVSLSWSPPVTGAVSVTDYLIEYSSDGGRTWRRFVDGTSAATAATVTGLRNGRTYVFRVAAVGASAAGPWSDISAAVTPSQPPRAPERLDADGGRRQVVLDWRAPSQHDRNPITDYVIQYSTDRGRTWVTYADRVSTSTRATVTGLENNTRYTFRVAAVNDAGQGRFSETASATTSRR